MKIKKNFLRGTMLLASMLLCVASAFAQVTVTGQVLDETNQPVIGASVLVLDNNSGTATDLDGNFTVKAPSKSSKIRVTYMGYKTVEITAATAGTIVLEPTAANLDEVVVIGYGAVKKSDATGSVMAIHPDELNKGNRVSAQDALVGKIAGVNVFPGSGAPGDGATIRIRSGASLSASNDPLIVIDGVPVDNSEINGASNIIGSINPEDIETFTVLKDASATAIYGSRASNGVIVITTKKGSDKVKVTYSGNFSLSHAAKTLQVLTADEFKKFVPTVTGVPSSPDFGAFDTDWQKEVLRKAFSTDQNLSVAGAINAKGFKSPYRVSVGATCQNGILKKSNYNRYSLALSLAPSLLDDHLTANLNGRVSYENNNLVSGSVMGSALNYDPTRSPYTGSPTAATDPGLGYFIWTNGGAPMAIQPDNPVSIIDLDKRKNNVLRSIGSAAIVYKIHGLEDLKLNVNAGYDVLRARYNEDVPTLAGNMYTSNQKDGTGLMARSTQRKNNMLLDIFGNYDKSFGAHTIGAMAGYGWQHFWKKFDQTRQDPTGKELASPYHSESEYYLVSFYGRVNYSYDNRYLATVTLRGDASSRFAKANRWGLFPSVALAWRASQEAFFKEQNVMSDLKVRLGWGVTGQQDILNDYPYIGTYSYSYNESSYKFGDKWYNMIRPNGYDKDIKWESTSTFNVGIDYGFLGNRIYGSIDYYKRYTKNLLNTINVVSGTNFSSVITTNIGKMENEGVEFSINAIPIKTADWEWNVGLNYTWNTSKITKLNTIDSESNYVTTGSISGTGKYVQVFMVGKRPYTFYLAKQAYNADGTPIEGQYVQPDGSISSTETRYATDKCALPTSLLGFNTSVKFKNWDLSIAGHGAFGFYVYNYVKADQYQQGVYSDQGYYANILKFTRDHGFAIQQLYSDYWLEKGDFFRIDNVTLGYTFKKLWDNSSSLRLTLGVSNLCTFSKYDGLDPEINNGIDRNVYPRPRTYNLGINLTF